MNGRIVVGIDGSEGSLSALTWGAEHARRKHMGLEIVSAWHSPAAALTPMGMAYIPPPELVMQCDAEQRVDNVLANQADRLAGIECRTVVAESEASALLCGVAEDADLLVVGSRGLGGFKGLIVGSVSARCANTAPCPVAIVPPDWRPPSTTAGSTVVGIDGSENSKAAVQWADHWIDPASTLRLVCVWDLAPSYARAEFGFSDQDLEAVCIETAAIAERLVTKHSIETRCVRGDARQELSAAAGEADALVVGARGHSGLARMIMGSIASSLLHHLVVPTVVVRPIEGSNDELG